MIETILALRTYVTNSMNIMATVLSFVWKLRTFRKILQSGVNPKYHLTS
jgi:hypothetical protein